MISPRVVSRWHTEQKRIQREEWGCVREKVYRKLTKRLAYDFIADSEGQGKSNVVSNEGM